MNDFPQLLTAAIRNSDLTLQQLSDGLRRRGTPLSTATLSYWRTGRTAPAREGSRQAVAHLEDLLGLHPGYLVSSLPGQSAQPWQPTAGLDYSHALRGALDAMGLDLDLHLAAQLVREEVTLDSSATRMLHRDVSLVRALDRVVERFAVLALTPTPDARLVRAGASHGCELMNARLVEGEVLVMDVRPERDLQAGDLLQPWFMVEWDSPAHRFTRLRQRMPQPVGHRSLLLRFECEAPLTVQAQVTSLDGDVTRRALVAGRQVMDAMVDAPAGNTVVTWEFGRTGEAR